MELVITQITDLHVSGEDDLDILLSRTKSIVGAISEVIRKPSETMLIICVTGDIANSGSKDQYAVASLFFDDISDKLEDRYSGDLCYRYAFIPGNHDCDFSSKIIAARTALISNKDTNIEDPGTVGICTSIQDNFFEFLQEYCTRDLALPLRKDSIFTENELIDQKNEAFKNYRIKLHCLNTAWCSQLHEKKDMRFTLPLQLEKKSNDIVITLMHHGPNWFDWNGNDVWDEYHRSYSDIILIGHDHKFSYVQEKNYDSSTNYFIKGNQFYSSDDKYQGGFNIIKVNLEDNIEIFYTYSWNNNDNVYERIINSAPLPFERNRFRDSSISIKQEIREYLEEIEIDIVNKYKSPLLLSDIYVFPVLQGDKEDKPDKTRLYRGQDEILNIIDSKKRIIIDGGKEYGKTGLLKRLFMLYAESDCFPIMFKGSEITFSDETSINKFVREKYAQTYNNINVDYVMQMENSSRICLIDDYDETIISDKGQKTFLENICGCFGMVILTCDDKKSMVGPVRNIETSEYLDSEFYKLDIITMRRVIKNKLIQKWLLIEDLSQDVNSLEFQAKVKAKTNQVQSVIKNGYFSNTPIEFLLVLSYIDNAKAISTDYSRYSYIYDSLIRECINEIAEQDTMKCSAYMTLLELLAYSLYEMGKGEEFEEYSLLRAIYKYNEEYPPFKQKPTQIIKKLIEHKILVERNDKYKFKFSYMYYYFVGSYIERVLSPEEKHSKISGILSDLSIETNYNIALFMAYSMNTEHIILPIVKEIEKGLLKEYEGFKYGDHYKLIGETEKSVLEKVDAIYQIPENEQIPELQERLREHRDELDEIELTEEKEISETEERARKNFEIIFSDFIKLLRLIQFEGEVLKNYAAKIKNQPRQEMISLMANSNLKLIGFFGNMISTELDKIIEVVERKAKLDVEGNLQKKEVLIQLIRDYMSVIWSQFIEINVSNLAICWDTDMIRQDVYSFKESQNSDFFDMVNIEYLFRISDSKLPVREIEQALSGKRKLDSFSRRIIERIIAGYLMNYQYDPVDKEKVCSLFGFNYKNMYLEEKKQEALGMFD